MVALKYYMFLILCYISSFKNIQKNAYVQNECVDNFTVFFLATLDFTVYIYRLVPGADKKKLRPF